jgi:hypothetical protein
MRAQELLGLWDFEPAAAKIEVLARLAGGVGLKDFRGKRVDHMPAVFAGVHKARVPKDAQVVRDVDNRRLQSGGDLAYVFRTGAQTIDDPQPFRVGQRAKLGRALLRRHIKRLLFHEWLPLAPRPCYEKYLIVESAGRN